MSCQCNALIVWDDDAVSNVCSLCGALSDASQSLLVSNEFSISGPSTTLKAVRSGWNLSGQGKEARNRKNEYLMSQLIKSVAISLNAPGLSPRAIHLFNQAMSTGLLWGRQAKRAAAVSLALALREVNRPHHLHDIASILNESFPALSRSFLSIASRLGFTFRSSDPSIYISDLQSYLISLVQDSALSASTLAQLKPLDLRSAVNVAYSLCAALMRPMADTTPAAAPIACAIFLLALESEARNSLHSIGDLARQLGAKYHVSKGTVMLRYKLFQDEIASWIEQVPWLDKYRNTGGRAKVSRRTIVARGLKDAIMLQEPCATGIHPNSEDRQKRRKVRHTTQLQSAAAFLLDPNSSPSQGASFSFASVQLLAPSVLSLPVTEQQPTRLQLLSRERGGSDTMQIPDEELFAQGELDAMLRTREEVEAIRPVLNLDSEKPVEQEIAARSHVKPPGREKYGHRVDVSAFEQFMASSIDQGETDDDPFFGLQLMEADNEFDCVENEDDDSDHILGAVDSCSRSQVESEIIIQEWRPFSP